MQYLWQPKTISLQDIEQARDCKIDGLYLLAAFKNNALTLTEQPIDLDRLTKLWPGDIYLQLPKTLSNDLVINNLENYQQRMTLIISSRQLAKRIHQLLPEVRLAVYEPWSGVRAHLKARQINSRTYFMAQRWLWSGFVRPLIRRNVRLYTLNVKSLKQLNRQAKIGVSGVVIADLSIIKHDR